MSVYKLKVEYNQTKINEINTVTKINVLNNVNTIVDGSNGFVTTSFVAGDTVKTIGFIPTNAKILNTIVDVTGVGGGTLTIGNDNYNAILQTVNDNDLNTINQYVVFNNYFNTAGIDYKCFFNSNLSSGTVTIYYH
jgi:hypothetical protein